MTEPAAPPFRPDDVRRHYAALAPTYSVRANRACARAYVELVRRVFGRSLNVLEIGAGTATLLPNLSAPLRVACDLSLPMLAAQQGPITWCRVAGDAQDLPFSAARFDGVYAVNVLEHVPEPRGVVSQVARLLRPGGRFLAVTPNGDVAGLLDWLERLRLKLPEGPHRFLPPDELAGIGGGAFRVLQHRRFLALPAGPHFFVRFVDALLAGDQGRGLFQYIVLERLAEESNRVR
jgi:phosphatidylethanolamine/phosphatidyl-N-methylethanolamine N-methyltransferase